jgi:mannose-6-phosphate isomerase-like protein (cupin superfamily)
MTGRRLNVAGALAKLPGPAGARFVKLFQHGTLEVEIYAPRGTDPQQPHRRDEIYVVAAGSGTFFCDGAREPFSTGDFLFVPAGVEHRFEEFTDDLAVWVVFYGPDGGENP